MTVAKRKTRMISVRVSEEEYASLRDLSSAEGARCISDYARAALLAQGSSVLSLERRVRWLDIAVRRLGTEIEELRRFLSVEQGISAP